MVLKRTSANNPEKAAPINAKAPAAKASMPFWSSSRASVALDRIKAGIREVLVLAAHTAGAGMVGIGRSNTLGGDGRERTGEKRGRPKGMTAKATGEDSALGEARSSGAAKGVVDWRSRAGATKAGAGVDAATAGA